MGKFYELPPRKPGEPIPQAISIIMGRNLSRKRKPKPEEPQNKPKQPKDPKKP